MNARKLTALLLSVMFVAASLPAAAHPSSQEGILQKEYMPSPDYNGYYIGGEKVGWFIDESCHSANGAISYRIASGTSSSAQTKMVNGAALWNNASNSPVTFTQVSSGGTGLFQAVSMGSGIKAVFDPLSVNSNNGHLTSWRIRLNSDYLGSINAVTVAHELGHVIGLNDLYELSNKNKLMYKTDVGRTATAPHAADIRGAEVITGAHISHTWSYEYYDTNSSGNNRHCRYCTHCRGIKFASIALCTYNASGVCTKCGTPQGYSPVGTGFPAAILPEPYAEQRRNLSLLL